MTTTEKSLRTRLLEDVFTLMDRNREYWKDRQRWDNRSGVKDLLVSDAYKLLTNKNGIYAPTFISTEGIGQYQFRGGQIHIYGMTSRAVFEKELESLGFELYQDKGRAYRIRYVE